MRVLITGGAGMVGSHCAEYYALQGHQVIVIDNLIRSTLFGHEKKSVEYNWEYLKQYRNIKLVKGDVRGVYSSMSIVKDIDLCIHTAGQPGVPLSSRKPLEDFSINALGTLNMLECLRHSSHDVTFIYCSTNKVYGENVGENSINEQMSIDQTGHTPYGVSKLCGDLYVQEYAHIYGMKTAVFRMSCIYGTRQWGFEDQGWVAHFIFSILNNKTINIFGDGTQVRDLLYVDDLVQAYDKFHNSSKRHGVYNIGGGVGNTRSLLEFIKEVKQLTGKTSRLKFHDWRPSDQKKYVTNNFKVINELNWLPNIDVRSGICNVIKWIKELG